MRIFRLVCGLNGKELHARLDDLDAVAIRRDFVKSVEELELAHALALDSFANKKNIARSIRYEFLLWLSGKTDIKSAMDSSAPQGGEFIAIVFSDDANAPGRLGGEMLPLGLEKNGEPLRLERISLSRVG